MSGTSTLPPVLAAAADRQQLRFVVKCQRLSTLSGPHPDDMRNIMRAIIVSSDLPLFANLAADSSSPENQKLAAGVNQYVRDIYDNLTGSSRDTYDAVLAAYIVRDMMAEYNEIPDVSDVVDGVKNPELAKRYNIEKPRIEYLETKEQYENRVIENYKQQEGRATGKKVSLTLPLEPRREIHNASMNINVDLTSRLKTCLKNLKSLSSFVRGKSATIEELQEKVGTARDAPRNPAPPSFGK